MPYLLTEQLFLNSYISINQCINNMQMSFTFNRETTAASLEMMMQCTTPT